MIITYFTQTIKCSDVGPMAPSYTPLLRTARPLQKFDELHMFLADNKIRLRPDNMDIVIVDDRVFIYNKSFWEELTISPLELD